MFLLNMKRGQKFKHFLSKGILLHPSGERKRVGCHSIMTIKHYCQKNPNTKLTTCPVYIFQNQTRNSNPSYRKIKNVSKRKTSECYIHRDEYIWYVTRVTNGRINILSDIFSLILGALVTNVKDTLNRIFAPVQKSHECNTKAYIQSALHNCTRLYLRTGA